MIATALKDWIPYKFISQADDQYCHWLYTGADRFTEPFFEETINRCRSLPHNAHFRKIISNADVLIEWSRHINSLPPSAIIFHVSRCGSTLISQLLGLSEENIILSEVPLFDEILRAKYKNHHINEMQSSALLKAAISFYAVSKNNNKDLYIKADSWHILFYEQLRALYPSTPFILLYRDPHEVLRSQQKQRGMQSVPGVLEKEIFEFADEVMQYTDLDKYMCKVLEKYFEKFTEIIEKDALAFLVNYKEGAISIVQKIAAITNTNITSEHLKKMQERSMFHAKYPSQVFNEQMPPIQLPEALEKTFNLYEKLETLRLATH